MAGTMANVWYVLRREPFGKQSITRYGAKHVTVAGQKRTAEAESEAWHALRGMEKQTVYFPTPEWVLANLIWEHAQFG